jgi:hypothetical protein
MQALILYIDPVQFQADFARALVDSGNKPFDQITSELVVASLSQHLKQAAQSNVLLRHKVEWLRPPFRQRELPPSLSQIIRQPILELGYFVISFTVSKSSPDIQLHVPSSLRLIEPPEVSKKELKTVTRYTIRFRSVAISTALLGYAAKNLSENCTCPTETLVPYIDGFWDWALRFICKFCGKAYFCDCFGAALVKRCIEAKAQASNYSSEGWPHRFLRAYRETGFRPKICHICTDSPSELFFCHPMYGSKVLVHYGPYVYKIATEKNISLRDAENEVRDILGIPRIGEGWLTEAELLHLVRAVLKDEEVIHQASPEWLGHQRIDIYVPHLAIAIEYQGRQHYEAVPFFGGEEALAANRARDQRKADLCAQHRVRMIYFRYDETITRKLVEARIQQTAQSPRT